MRAWPLVALAVAGCGSSSSLMMDGTAGAPPGADEARVIFWRYKAYAAHSYEWGLYDGDAFLGEIENGASFEYRCKPGRHLFFTLPASTGGVDADLAGGKTYYIRFGATMGGASLVPLTKGNAEERGVRDEKLGACRARATRPERHSEYAAKKREAAAKRAAELRADPSKCAKLAPDDGE